jgi:hypothetical protein
MPGVIATKALFPIQSDRDIVTEFGKRQVDYPLTYTAVFHEMEAPKGKNYVASQIAGLGTLQDMDELGAASFDTMVEGHKFSLAYSKFGLATAASEEAIQDDLQGYIAKVPSFLDRSVNVKKELLAWSLFANAETQAGSTSWDGLAMLATNHTLLRGAQTLNNAPNAALSTTTLQAAFDYYATMVAQDGYPIPVQANKLIAGQLNQWLVRDLQKSTGRVWDYDTTADPKRTKGLVGQAATYYAVADNQAQNLLRPGSGPNVGNWEPVMTPWLDAPAGLFANSGSWFLLGENPEPESGPTILWKLRPKITSRDDEVIHAHITEVRMRLAVMNLDPLFVYGNVA